MCSLIICRGIKPLFLKLIRFVLLPFCMIFTTMAMIYALFEMDIYKSTNYRKVRISLIKANNKLIVYLLTNLVAVFIPQYLWDVLESAIADDIVNCQSVYLKDNQELDVQANTNRCRKLIKKIESKSLKKKVRNLLLCEWLNILVFAWRIAFTSLALGVNYLTFGLTSEEILDENSIKVIQYNEMVKVILNEINLYLSLLKIISFIDSALLLCVVSTIILMICQLLFHRSRFFNYLYWKSRGFALNQQHIDWLCTKSFIVWKGMSYISYMIDKTHFFLLIETAPSFTSNYKLVKVIENVPIDNTLTTSSLNKNCVQTAQPSMTLTKVIDGYELIMTFSKTKNCNSNNKYDCTFTSRSTLLTNIDEPEQGRPSIGFTTPEKLECLEIDETNSS